MVSGYCQNWSMVYLFFLSQRLTILFECYWGVALDHQHGLRYPRPIKTLFPSWFKHSAFFQRISAQIIEHTQGKMGDYGLTPEGPFYSTHPTVSQELLHRICKLFIQFFLFRVIFFFLLFSKWHNFSQTKYSSI